MGMESEIGGPPADEEVTRFVPRLLQPGDVIAHYRIVRLLGRGGSGAIYEARNVYNDGERAALKIVQPDIPDRAIFFDLLRAEANALQEVKHDAVVQFRTFGRIEGSDEFYLVIEFVEGPTLGEAMRKQALAPEAVRKLALRLADGLEAAHAQGVIHRDLSPDNVILPDGEVDRATLIDFSIARNGAFDPIGAAFAGKYSYAAPEQFAGDVTAVGPWTDLYTLGLVLAAAARGKKLDMGNDVASAIEKRRAVPPLDDLAEEVRGPIAALLEPDPAKRVRTAAEAAALFMSPTVLPAAITHPSPAPVQVDAETVEAPKRGGARWWVAGVAAAVLIAAGGIGAYAWLAKPTPSETAALAPKPAAPVQPAAAPAPTPTPPPPVPAEPAPKGDAPPVPAAPVLDQRLADTIDLAKAAAAKARDAAAKAQVQADLAKSAAERGRQGGADALAAAQDAQDAAEKACGSEPPPNFSCADNADGSRYAGEFGCSAADCAEPDHGVATLANDPRSFAGLWKADVFIAGCDIIDGAFEFCGPWKDMALSGFGTQSASDGAITAGQFEAGVISGPAELDLSATANVIGKTMRGENVSSGTLTGYGVVEWKSGDVSSGKWDAQTTLEEGVMRSTTGVTTASVRSEGSPTTGLVTYKDGRSYLGEFVDDGHLVRRNGLGVLYDAKGAIAQQGRWQDDALVKDFSEP